MLKPIFVCMFQSSSAPEATSFASYEPAKSAGPQANRLHALKAAFSVSGLCFVVKQKSKKYFLAILVEKNIVRCVRLFNA